MTAQDDRPLKPALKKGWKRKCPNCSQGDLLSGFLSVHENCPVCNETFSHHRADDGPAYLTILAVGHIVGPLMLFVFEKYDPPSLVMFGTFSTLALILSAFLLPRFKGALIALQWSRRMHGFGQDTKQP